MSFCWVVGFLIYLIIVKCENKDCDQCRSISKQFVASFKKSDGKSFAGGNSLWEETNLGSYATSEVRFHEIIDGICDKNDNKCHLFLENYELHIEDWWNKNFKENSEFPERIEEYLCINITKSCCHYGFYGPLCSPCPVCSKFGGICHGNGSRIGSGDCVCHTGYTGKYCSECESKSHFVLNEGADNKCLQCHIACGGGCSGPSSRDCAFCTTGWISKENSGVSDCVDVNECDDNPCDIKKQYCNNEPGSFHCLPCNVTCLGCTGPGSDECINCAPGFQRGYTNNCEDINECNADSNLCQAEGEQCTNLMGTYRCDCKTGYTSVNGICTPDIKQKVESHGKVKPGKKFLKEKQNNVKIIWTVPYAKEFLKYLSVLSVFSLFCWCTKTQPFITAFGVLAFGYFVYQESIKLDFVFSRQK